MEEKFQVLQGNSVEVLKNLPDGIVDCCITSPPYYALRDYGTGRWEGGDVNCPHYRTSKYSEITQTGHKAQMENGSPVGDAIYKSICPLCGAKRVDAQIGLEETPEEYIKRLVEVFHEVKRVLKDDGTLWVNIGDSYCGTGDKGNCKDPKQPNGRNGQVTAKNRKLTGIKQKDLIGIPWMLAFALRNDGWYLRQDIIWAKPNCMPESVHDRCTKSHEYIFLLSKKPNYYFNADAIKVKANEVYASRHEYDFYQAEAKHGSDRPYGAINTAGKKTYTGFANKRDVWTVNVGGGYSDENGAHYATYPTELIQPCILAGSARGGYYPRPI